MPRYHLHLHNAHVDASDEEGTVVPDLDAAKAEALAGIRDFLAHEIQRGVLDLRGRVDIADEGGHVFATVHFVDAVAITTP